MATIGGNNSFQLLKNAHKSGASTVAQQGLGGGISKQLKDTGKPKESKPLKETVSPELAKALEQAKNQDSAAAAKSEVADNAAQANAKKGDISDDKDELGFGPGEMEKPKPGFVFVDGADGDEQYQIKEADANKVARMDGQSHADRILGDMPEGARKASEATLNNQIESKGTDAVSQMKEGPKDFAVAVENMDLEPAEDWKAAGSTPAPIRSPKHEPPKPQLDEDHNNKLAGDMAKKKMLEGANEAFVA